MRRALKSLPRLLGMVAINVVAGVGAAATGETVGSHVSVSNIIQRGAVETVYFTDRKQLAVNVVRGVNPTGGLRVRHEILTFHGATAQRVAVIRGIIEPADPARSSVTMPRGGAVVRGSYPADLFNAGSDEQLVRIADAVHGAESSYGTDLRMWRLDDLSGPQGPMQVSAAAALEVGGGDRFDAYQNVMLGRAYLGRLFRRYGNWSDALAAYNWGLGNVDQWVARGRNVQQLPAETTQYIERVLRQAFLGSVGGAGQRRISKR